MRKNSSTPASPAAVRRRAVTVGAIAVAASLFLQGCSAGGGSTSASGDSSGAVELTFLNQSRGQEAALNQLAEQYSKEKGIKITVDSPGPTDYLPKLQAKAQSKSMPDIYSSFNATDMAPFYKAGWAMNLESELQGDWGKNFSPAVIKMSTFADGNNLGVPSGIYTAHWETQTYGLLLDTAATGIDPKALPKTSSELISKLAAASKNGQGTFSVAASLTPQLIQGFASNWLTDEEISATFDGKASWKSDGWRNAFQLLVDLKKAGVIANGSLTGGQNDNPTVEASFFSKHEVGAIFDASPGVSVGFKTAPDYNSFISLTVPPAANGKLAPRSPGLPGKGAVINPKGKHPKEALEFVKWLTAPAQQKVFAEVGHIMPSNPELLASGTLSPQLSGFGAGVKDMQVLPNTIKTNVNTAIIRDAQGLVLGELTIDQVLDDLQAAQDKS
ncbi:ABC transporter substrate-binding protein [Paenarthrobacter sp. 2TAF44]|uniref:ABC transporter substrate-binding protein n=1 Tax=Paenarthrobacter sp. 2TAF44 TaxID=3233018 RepID=UPI003F94AD28